MTTYHGKDIAVTVNAEDLSEYVNTSTLTAAVDAHDVTTYGNEAHRKTGGLKDGTFSIGGFDDFDAAALDAILAAIYDGGVPVPVVFRPAGVGVGVVEKTFSALMTSYAIEGPVADMVSFTAEFELDTVVTNGAQA